MADDTPLPSADESSAEPENTANLTSWEANGASSSNGLPPVEADVPVADSTNAVEATRATDTPAPAVAPSAPASANAGAPDATQDDGTVFLAHLAAAMKETATAERTRVSDDIDRRRESHMAGIDDRRASEAGRIRSLAEDDKASIEAWVASEQQRISDERDRRMAGLEADLKASLAEHGSRIEAEKERVDAAIARYRLDVEAYFAKLERATDPVVIAHQAGHRPAFPDLEAIAHEAPALAAAAAAPEAAAEPPPAETPTVQVPAAAPAAADSPVAEAPVSNNQDAGFQASETPLAAGLNAPSAAAQPAPAPTSSAPTSDVPAAPEAQPQSTVATLEPVTPSGMSSEILIGDPISSDMLIGDTVSPDASAAGVGASAPIAEATAAKEDSAATASAPNGGRMIGVMASSRPTTKLAEAWAAWTASTAAAEAQAAAQGSDAAEPAPEPQVAPETRTVAGAYVPPAPIDDVEAQPVGVAAGSESGSAP